MKDVFLCAAKRTAIASFQGSLSQISAPQLGAHAINALFNENDALKASVDEVYMGCVLTSGQGQAPARQAALAAKLSDNVPCTTVGKVCGSGLKSVILGAQSIALGENDLVVAGGMESMSQAPYLLPKMRAGHRMGHGNVVDSMIHDGLWDAYNDEHMGKAGELCAQKYNLSREAQDAFAIRSYKAAQKSTQEGLFKNEIAPLKIRRKKEEVEFSVDEEAQRFQEEKFQKLRPAFDPEGSITAGNASSLSDGSAAVLLASEEAVQKHGLKALIKIRSWGQSAQDPQWFTTAPASSIKNALKKGALEASAIDFWEINEAFSVVALVNTQLLELDPDKINVRGGSVALGHPIGASGTRILVTLVHTLLQEEKKYGCASLCIGGGEGISLVVENLCL